MKTQSLCAALVLLFLITGVFGSNESPPVIDPGLESVNAFSQDSLNDILFPENFAIDLATAVKATRPRVEESTGLKNTDPMLAKATGWAEFFWVNDNHAGWQELNSAQLFYSNGQEIIGYVYGHNDKTTPFGPSCYITESDYNMQIEEFIGAAFRCSSGEVFYFFSHNGRKYLAIYYNNRTRVYSN